MKNKTVRPSWFVPLIIGSIIGALPAAGGPPQPASPERIKELITAAGDAEDYDDSALVYVLDEADVYVQPSGLATTESCQVIKILSDAGVRSQCVQRFDFDPATRRVTVKSARIHRADGTIEEVPVSSLVTQPTVQNWIYWGGDQHLLPLPGLEIGDAIEIRVSKIGFNIAYLHDNEPASAGQQSRDREGAVAPGRHRLADGGPSGSAAGAEETLQPPMPGHWYEVTLFQGRHPIIEKRYSVHMPQDMPVQYEVYNGELKSSMWFEDEFHVFTWWAKDVPVVKSEPRMVALDDCATKLVMATVPDWEMKSRWFHEVNEPQFEADDAIRATVAEITVGLDNLDDKIAACNHWVADNIRYCGTSRGPREGFTLHRGIETFRDRAGVCKDKAGMLVTMMRVLGVETYPALTMAGSRVEAIPADQFNHTVTVMREEDGEFRILDPTWIPLSREMWSSREALQGLVYGTPEGQTLTLSPYYPPEYNQLTCRSQARLDESGALSAQITMDMKGYPCTYLRRNIDRYRRPQLRAAVEHTLNIAPNTRLVEFNHTDPYDYSRDSQAELTVSAERYAAGDGTRRLFRLPLMTHPLADWLIPDFFYPFNSDERQYGYHMRASRGLRYEENIQLPDGWSVEELPSAEELDSPAASLKFHAETSAGVLTYVFEMDLKKHSVSAEEYAGLKEAIDTMKKLTDEWIVCRAADQRAPAGEQAALSPSRKEVTYE